ncbi:Lar family restriction alleviation protein [Agrobacterium sp. CG674]
MAGFTLEPCPTCGGNARLSYNKGRSVIGTPWHREYVVCGCGLQTKIFKYPGGAIKLWNRRPSSAPKLAEAV